MFPVSARSSSGSNGDRTFVDGSDVCSILHYITTMEALKEVPVVQLATVDAGKIIALEVFFDASEYNKMLAG